MQLEECDQLKENIPAYALGALDVDDSAALEIHLRNCRGCQSELEQYRAVSEGLLFVVAPLPPSAAFLSGAALSTGLFSFASSGLFRKRKPE